MFAGKAMEFVLLTRPVARPLLQEVNDRFATGEAPQDYPVSKPVPSEWFRLHVWEADTGRGLCAPIAHRGGVFALANSAGGCRVLTGSGDGKLKLWGPATWREFRSFDADPNFVRNSAFGPTGERCLSAGSQPSEL
jgi:WD40 repeat protein